MYPVGGTGAVPRAWPGWRSNSMWKSAPAWAFAASCWTRPAPRPASKPKAGERVPLAAVVSNADAVRTHWELLVDTAASREFQRPAQTHILLESGISAFRVEFHGHL